MDKLKQELIGLLTDLVSKLRQVLTSAKFWTMILSDASSLSLYLNKQIDAPMFLAAIVAAGVAYTGAKAYEDSHTIPSAH